MTDELRHLLYDGQYDSVHQGLCKVFEEDIFRRTDGLTTSEQAEVAYARLRFLNANVGPADVLLTDPQRLWAVSEWSGIIDGTLLALVGIHYNLCVGTIIDAGNRRAELDGYLQELNDMTSIGVFLATELAHGNNVAALETEAVYDRSTDEFVLRTPHPRACKFMPNTGQPGVSKIAVVMARLILDGRNEGVFPFIVRIRDEHGLRPGITVMPLREKVGWSLDNAMTSFDEVRIPRVNLLTGSGSHFTSDGTLSCRVARRRNRFLNAMGRVQAGKIMLSAASAAMARASMYITIRYAYQRRTFGTSGGTVPVVSYRTYQADVYGALAKTYAMTLLMNHAKRTWLNRTEEADPHVEIVLAVAKAFCTWGAEAVMRQCRERCGAQGLLSDNRIADYLIANQGSVTAEGDNQVVLLKAAQQMVLSGGYQPPAVRPYPNPGDFSDLRWLLWIFEQREVVLHQRLAARLRRTPGDERDRFQAWNDATSLALTLAEAHGEHLAMRAFVTAVEQTADGQVRQGLSVLAALHATQTLSPLSGWCMVEGLVAASQVGQMPDVVDDLCAALLPHAEAMVEAFGIPNSVLLAPIATDDYIQYYADRVQPA